MTPDRTLSHLAAAGVIDPAATAYPSAVDSAPPARAAVEHDPSCDVWDEPGRHCTCDPRPFAEPPDRGP